MSSRFNSFNGSQFNATKESGFHARGIKSTLVCAASFSGFTNEPSINSMCYLDGNLLSPWGDNGIFGSGSPPTSPNAINDIPVLEDSTTGDKTLYIFGAGLTDNSEQPADTFENCAEWDEDTRKWLVIVGDDGTGFIAAIFSSRDDSIYAIAGSNIDPSGINAYIVSRYDGTSWNALGDQGTTAPGVRVSSATSCTTWRDKIVFNGAAFTPPPQATFAVYDIDTDTWTTLRPGIADPVIPDLVRGLTFTNSDGEREEWLFFHSVTGSDNVWAFDNDDNFINLTPNGGVVGVGGNLSILDMTIFNGDLVVCGRFSSINGVEALSVARWNQTDGWRAMGDGVNLSFFFDGTPLPAELNAIHVDNDALYVTGVISTDPAAADTSSFKGIARFFPGKNAKWVQAMRYKNDDKAENNVLNALALASFTGKKTPLPVV